MLNKQWVPQARDVFKQKKDMVTFTRTLWLLSRERAAGEEGKLNTEANTPGPHHVPLVNVLLLPFVFPQVLHYSGKLFLTTY